MTPPRQRPPRKRAPQTNPELAVRRAERAIIAAEATAPQPVVDPELRQVARVMADGWPQEPPAVRVRADDPPAYVDTWNALHALTHGTHEQEVTRSTRQGV